MTITCDVPTGLKDLDPPRAMLSEASGDDGAREPSARDSDRRLVHSDHVTPQPAQGVGGAPRSIACRQAV